MLNDVKIALRVSTNAFDGELTDMIAAAQDDLGVVGIDTSEQMPLVKRAIITYCKLHFGEPSNYDRLKASYDEQKAQLKTTSFYRNRGVNNGSV